MNSTLEEKDRIISGLRKNISSLNDENEELGQKYNRYRIKSFIITFANSLKAKKQNLFQRWKQEIRKSIIKPTDSTKIFAPARPSINRQLSYDISYELSPEAAQSYAIAEEIMYREKQEVLANNVLIKNLRESGVQKQKPMTYHNVFKFFEEMMDKKFETDKKDLRDLR